MGEVPCQELVQEIDGPEYIVDNQQDKGVVVIPADEE